MVILKALLITIVVEIIVLLVMREKAIKVYLVSILINVFSNISFNLLVQTIFEKNYDIVVILLEIVIVIFEGLIYSIYFKKFFKSLKISFICNLCSYVIGLLLLPFIY